MALAGRRHPRGWARQSQRPAPAPAGWVIFYFHLRSDSIAAVGTRLAAGDALGVASCEGGRSTGTHVHVARKYNGEWLAADSLMFGGRMKLKK